MTMTPEELDVIEARAARATEGPWNTHLVDDTCAALCIKRTKHQRRATAMIKAVVLALMMMIGLGGGDFLGGKVLLISPILAVFIGCLGKAIKLANAGLGETAIGYWGIGVAGIFGTMLLGAPIIFGLF